MPVSSSIVLFSPGSGSLSSLGVKDITDGPENSLILATDNGRSTFNGSWEIVHVNRNDYHNGPLSDFVTALEYDHARRLWIGYSNGLQILDGSSYTTINDQQLLINLAINDIQSRGNEMWVATGQAGLHRYRDGIWTWFRPLGERGPGSYEISSMAVDYVSGALYCAAEDGALWVFSGEAGSGGFDRFEGDGAMLPGPERIVSCPFGGIAGFNSTAVYTISPEGRVRQAVNACDLPWSTPVILDIAFTDEGTLVIGTNRGLVLWENGRATHSLGPEDGIGNPVIERVYVDNAGRVWFFNRMYAGIFLPEDGDDPIVIKAPPGTPELVPVETALRTVPSPVEEPVAEKAEVLQDQGAGEPPASLPVTILGTIRSAIEAFFSMFTSVL